MSSYSIGENVDIPKSHLKKLKKKMIIIDHFIFLDTGEVVGIEQNEDNVISLVYIKTNL